MKNGERNVIQMVLFGALFAMSTACVRPFPQPQPAIINWTMQPIELAKSLRPGMSENQVIEIMGQPVTRDFQKDGVALQWCKTGDGLQFPLDRFVIGFFYKDRLVGTRNYQGQANVYGDCATLYKGIEWHPADKIIEYRFR